MKRTAIIFAMLSLGAVAAVHYQPGPSEGEMVSLAPGYKVWQRVSEEAADYPTDYALYVTFNDSNACAGGVYSSTCASNIFLQTNATRRPSIRYHTEGGAGNHYAWFDGTDDFIKGTNDPGYATTWSLVARVRRDNTDERDVFFSQGATSGVSVEVMCHLGFDREGTGSMGGYMKDSEGTFLSIFSSAAEAVLDDGDWHDVAYVWTNGVSQLSFQLWVDGVKYPPSTWWNPVPPFYDSPHPITIGNRADYTLAATYPFDGDLDGIAFFWRVLSSQELVQCRANMPW